MILYIVSQGSNLSINSGEIIINQKDGLIRKIPKFQVEAINLFFAAHITSDLIKHCLINEIPINFFSARGKYFGRLNNVSTSDIIKLKNQIMLSEDSNFSLELSKKIIRAKANNQLTILRRNERKEGKNKELIKDIAILSKKIDSSRYKNELLGIEGMIARLYFKALSNTIKEEFSFTKRNRRPPKDPFNSIISLGYTLVLNEIVSCIESSGLNPFCGFLHEDRLNHPSLASDMLEEYRSVIVDSLAVDVLNNKFTTEDFEKDGKGIFLKEIALRKFLEYFEKKLMKEQNYRGDGKTSFRRTIYLQTKDLSIAIKEKNIERYKPIWIR